MSQIKLLYLGRNITGTITKTPNGVQEIIGYDGYYRNKLRNVRVFRIDLLKYMDRYFSMEILNPLRDTIYGIISGKTSIANQKKEIIEFFRGIFEYDDKFKIAIGNIYFDSPPNLAQESIYTALIYNILNSSILSEKTLINNLHNCRFLFTSHLYCYFSISNQEDLTVLQNDMKGFELFSL